jgi:hypothetical protein
MLRSFAIQSGLTDLEENNNRNLRNVENNAPNDTAEHLRKHESLAVPLRRPLISHFRFCVFQSLGFEIIKHCKSIDQICSSRILGPRI